jgi:Zn-dependent protease with chaperone function
LLARVDSKQEGANYRQVFRWALALGLGGLIVAAVAVGAEIVSLHHTPVSSHRLVIAGLRFTYPSLNGAEGVLLALAALATAAITSAVRASWHQRRAYRSFIGELAVVGPLEGHAGVTVIADPRPQAFCAGYLRPAVYVSERTLALLTDGELEAVLAHEHHHSRVRDPLRLACGRVLSQALFFMPALRLLADRYADVAELRADEAAVAANAGQKQALAAALLAFDQNGPPEVTGISPERVDSLLGEPVRWRLPWWRMTASLGALSSLGVLIWLSSELASAHATFSLPILSSQPCVVMTMVLPLLGCFRMIARRQNGTRGARAMGQLAAPG